MFVDHTMSTTNNKKHKMLVPLIEQFKQNDISRVNIQLDERVKMRILAKICRRCVFSQLESIIDIFDLRSLENRSLVIHFINEQLEQQQDIIFIAHMTKILKLLPIDVISPEKVRSNSWGDSLEYFYLIDSFTIDFEISMGNDSITS